MKKFLFILLVLLFIPTVKAFDINLDKLDFSSYDDKLTENLDKTYTIDATGYKQVSTYNKDIQSLTKELIQISLSSKDKTEKLKDLTKYMYLSNDSGLSLSANLFFKTFVEKISDQSFTYDYIKIIRTSQTEKGTFAFAYIPSCVINDKIKDVIVVYWFKEDEDGFKLFYPWITYDDELMNYFDEVTSKENFGNNIGLSYNKITTEETAKVDEVKLQNIYNKVAGSNVQITGLNAEKEIYGSGFFIRKGLVVTTWSLVKKIIDNNSFAYINDSSKNSYKVEGLVAANIDYDVAILKVSEEVGEPVTFASPTDLKTNDNLYTINSKVNTSFSINYGKFLNLKDGKIEKMFAMSKSDIGSGLYNDNGEVVGFNTEELLNSELSYGNSTDYLIKLQTILTNQEFANISSTSLEQYQEKNNMIIEEEKEEFDIPKKVWNKIKEIGKLEENISLKLIKAHYENKIVSLRYKNSLTNSIDTDYILADYIEQLEEDGYSKSSNSYRKTILKSDEYQIIIKNEMDYLIILIMEL